MDKVHKPIATPQYHLIRVTWPPDFLIDIKGDYLSALATKAPTPPPAPPPRALTVVQSCCAVPSGRVNIVQ
jgi:hypothetical protein